MAWTTPKDWAVDEQLTASKLNTHLRDNLNALKSPPSDNYECNEGSDYSSNSTSFADVDGTNLSLTITTNGGDVMVGFHGTFQAGTNATVFLDVYVDTADDGGDDGYVVQIMPANSPETVSFVRLITGLSAGSHTFKLRWKTNGATVTLFAGAGTSNRDMHPQFWVREVS